MFCLWQCFSYHDHCVLMGPYFRDRVHTGTFFTVWVPIDISGSLFSVFWLLANLKFTGGLSIQSACTLYTTMSTNGKIEFKTIKMKICLLKKMYRKLNSNEKIKQIHFEEISQTGHLPTIQS